jgi:UDP-hydrolysing UDP-N-acetyl-D-glucosamine 2-epimerase
MIVKRKILYLVSNRCSYYRSKFLLEKMNRDHELDLMLLVTSSILEPGFEAVRDEITSNFRYALIPLKKYTGSLDSMTVSAAKLQGETNKVIKMFEPDCVVLWHDRWELLPVALAAAYTNTLLCHIGAGEDSGNIDQKVRHAVSMMSDICFPPHEHAYMRLRMMGLRDVHNFGCPAIDTLRWTLANHTVEQKDAVICIFHPHTKEIKDIKFQSQLVLQEVTRFCSEHYMKLYWFGPNNDPGYKDILKELKDIEVITNMVEADFLKLLASCKMIVGNSSAGIREASSLGTPSVNIGDRQAGRIMADNVVSCDFDHIFEAMKNQLAGRVIPSTMFGMGYSSDKIIKQLKTFLDGRMVP